jgi:hypothetical protein
MSQRCAHAEARAAATVSPASHLAKYKSYIALMIRGFGGVTERDLMRRFKVTKHTAGMFMASYMQEHPNTIAYNKHNHRYEKVDK